jgi:hypothetical protein
MTNGFLIFSKRFAHFLIYKKALAALPHIILYTRSLLNFRTQKEIVHNFFISAAFVGHPLLCLPQLTPPPPRSAFFGHLSFLLSSQHSLVQPNSLGRPSFFGHFSLFGQPQLFLATQLSLFTPVFFVSTPMLLRPPLAYFQANGTALSALLIER